MNHVASLRLLTAAFLTLSTAACTQATAEPFEPTPAEPLAAQIDGAAFAFAPHREVNLVATGVWLDASPTSFLLDLEGGSAEVVVTDEQVVLTTLFIELDGFDHELPGGSHFTDIALVLEEPHVLATTWDDERVAAEGELALRLDWSVATDDATTQLASQDVEDMPITLSMRLEDGALVLDAQLRGVGGVFSLPDLFEVEELDVAIAGSATR